MANKKAPQHKPEGQNIDDIISRMAVAHNKNFRVELIVIAKVFCVVMAILIVVITVLAWIVEVRK